MSAGPARGALPDGVTQSLREAFAAEIATRLPHLRALADPEVARRDAHTLASSALLLGEAEIGRLGRAVERQLEDGDEADDLGALVAALERFTP